MKLHFDMTNAPPEFANGFAAALAFTHDGQATVDVTHPHWILFNAPNIYEDNVTYVYKDGGIYPESTGVEE